MSAVEEKVNNEIEAEEEPEAEDLAEVVIIPENASQLKEIEEVIPEPVHISKTYDTQPEDISGSEIVPENVQESEMVPEVVQESEIVPESVKDQPELVLENKEQEEATKTDAVEETEMPTEKELEAKKKLNGDNI